MGTLANNENPHGMPHLTSISYVSSGADPGFLKGGFSCVEEGVRFVFLILLEISHENEIIWSH